MKPLRYPPANLIRGKLCELVAVGPGGSGVRVAKA